MARKLSSVLPGVGGSVLVQASDVDNTSIRVKGAELVFIHKVSAADIATISASTKAVLTRNAVGDISLNVTAGGAETHYFYPRSLPPLFTESTGKGVEITKVRVAYELGVVNATSVDLNVKKVVFAQATNPVVSDLAAAVADAQFDTNHNTAAKRLDSTVANGEHLMEWTAANGTFMVTADAIPTIELAVVLALTGTLKVRGFEIEYTYTEPADV